MTSLIKNSTRPSCPSLPKEPLLEKGVEAVCTEIARGILKEEASALNFAYKINFFAQIEGESDTFKTQMKALYKKYSLDLNWNDLFEKSMHFLKNLKKHVSQEVCDEYFHMLFEDIQDLSVYVDLSLTLAHLKLSEALYEEVYVEKSLLWMGVDRLTKADIPLWTQVASYSVPRFIFRKKLLENNQEEAQLFLRKIEEINEKNNPSKQYSEHYICRETTLRLDLAYNHQDQTKYGAFLHETVLLAREDIFFTEEKDPFLLLSFCALRRYELAMKNGHGGSAKEDFGSPASSRFITNCNKGRSYEKLGKRLLQKQSSLEKESMWHKKHETEEELQQVIKTCVSFSIPSNPFYVKPEDPLKSALSCKCLRKEQEHFLSIFCVKETSIFILHTNSRKMDEFGASLLKELFQEALNHDTPRDILPHLGRLFWWICQLKPWRRGDPSIAEMFIKSIYLRKTGKIAPRWAVGIIPWEEVSIEFNPEVFASNFIHLFDKKDLENEAFF